MRPAEAGNRPRPFPAARHDAAGRTFRALVVDADQETLAFTAEALNSFVPGFEVATARTLEEAGAWLERFRPDVVLLDMRSSCDGADGFLARIRDDPRTRSCRIVLLSRIGSPGPSDLDAGIALLRKPFGLGELLATVRGVLAS